MKTAPKNPNRFRFLALSAVLFTYLAMVLGNMERVSEIPAYASAHRSASILAGLLLAGTAVQAWRRHRSNRLIIYPLLLALVLLLAQSLLGVLAGKSPGHTAQHLGFSLLIFALVILAAAAAFVYHRDPGRADRLSLTSPFARKAATALILLFTVLASGAFVAANQATGLCSAWPLCGDEWLPANSLGWINMTHRLLVGLGAWYMLHLLVQAWRTQRSQRAILSAATLTVVLYFSQFLVGALKVWQGYPGPLLALHAASSATVFGLAVLLLALVGLAARSPQQESAEAAIPIDRRQRARDLLGLTKPLIVALLLVTTYAGMVVGARAIPSLSLTFWTLLGGALAAGGSGAVNQYIDRELDQRMTRTAWRPIASGRMTPAEGLAFGLALLVASFYIFAAFVNMLAAFLALAGMVYYIFIYSIWLKQATVQNIVIGGGAGAIPPMVGWAAATGSLAIPAFFLFAIIFMWTPPHFWALALVRQKDYARAGVPMLPVVRGERATRWQIFIYTLELVALTLLYPILGMAGGAFLVAALVLGALLIITAWRVWRVGGNKIAWRMYRYSSMYLALLFAALVLDALI